MKSSSKINNRVIADIPLFGHILGEVKEEVPDVDPQLQVKSSSSKEEVEQVQGNQEAEFEVEQNIEQEMEQPVQESQFIDKEIENLDPLDFHVHDVNIEAEAHVDTEVQRNVEVEVDSSETLDEGIYGTNSDYEKEEPLDKKIKTGLESLTSSSESLFDIPEHLTPTHSPILVPPPSPQPSLQHAPVPTPHASPAPDLSSSVPRVKTLSVEVKKLQEKVTKQDKVIEGLKTELRECTEEVKDLKMELSNSRLQWLNLLSKEPLPQLRGRPLLPMDLLPLPLLKNPQSALTIFTGPVAKTKESMEVKNEETEFDLPSISERKAARERGKGKE
ncbi:hypothetical protein L1987_09043 [Smallanthus sonchifolius]|uniref:Uncharacterized protein n=1 Tax=Smallanthus sonchifolius TaxID=185202 RepID=A0ACB9JMD3_9ASTR|nr:hypothetical protein L1987_09043 [Smallanthus sonchifolius]